MQRLVVLRKTQKLSVVVFVSAVGTSWEGNVRVEVNLVRVNSTHNCYGLHFLRIFASIQFRRFLQIVSKISSDKEKIYYVRSSWS
jgi:hypothetical protein